MRFHGALLGGAMLAFLSMGCGAKKIEAGGSTFVHPMMKKWADEYYKEKGIPVHYQAIGSGDGIQKMEAKAFDFSCTEAPLTDEEMKKVKDAGGEILHVPLVLGGVVPAYNLDNLKEPLRFTGPILADIYLGKIKKWNDPALMNLNPDAKLPDLDISVVHRSDGSGTTYIWADYLAKVSPEWKAKLGVGRTLPWPCGVAEPGNAGVTKKVKQTPGALGYIELTFALQEGISFGMVQNKEGAFILASPGTVTEAASATVANEDIPEDLRFSLTDRAGKLTYPISGATFAILYRDQPSAKVDLIMRFLRWVTDEGQQMPEPLKYARFPQGLIDQVHAMLDKVEWHFHNA